MTGNTPTYDSLAEVLKTLVERFGSEIFNDRRRLVSLLADHLPEAKRELRVVRSAVDEGVPSALISTERHLSGIEMDRQAGRLEAGTGLRIDIARQVVRAFAYSLGLGPLPSVYETPSSDGEVSSQSSGDNWAGLSQPVQSETGGKATNFPPKNINTNSPKKDTTKKAENTITIGQFTFDRKYAAIALAIVAVVIFGILDQFGGDDAIPSPDNNDPVVVNNNPVDTTGYANELTNWGVPAKSTLESNVGSATPISIPVGRRVTTGEVQNMIARDASVQLIDVLANSHGSTIKNSVFIPSGGYGGNFNDNAQQNFVASLRSLFGSNTSIPTIFFCAGSECWESYNAVLRANAAGYSNLYWYRGGLASWSAAGLPMEPTPPPR
ncbi:rhodanese-like domain-containing protein [Sneathiella sp. HT1-7]|uniref:rhodanese-like domain-containing protein n=1 Tax=Sneathiella sp. HT1-7 TaxID=2887192 RepID=UPI001D135D69|nr:rhodanese-like domain-containing protein [Sneathiella sp. HT1-7]MCC3306030.1 hypothetical protein [Sneathiella sp. HT1-7]